MRRRPLRRSWVESPDSPGRLTPNPARVSAPSSSSPRSTCTVPRCGVRYPEPGQETATAFRALRHDARQRIFLRGNGREAELTAGELSLGQFLFWKWAATAAAGKAVS